MSNEEVNADTEDPFTNEDEDQLWLDQRELILLVKNNPALYTKSNKEYCGKGYAKDLTWQRIGSSLTKPLSGPEASKLFYNIRQRFGRERRKVADSIKGKSGQGTMAQYVPTWPLYEDCMFLADHIVARKTSSSYKKPIQKAAASFQVGGATPTFARPSPSPSPPVFRSTGARPSPSPSPPVFRSTGARRSSSPSPPVFGSTDARRSSSPSPPVFGSTDARRSSSPSPPVFGSTDARRSSSPSPPVFGSTNARRSSSLSSPVFRSAWSSENELFWSTDNSFVIIGLDYTDHLVRVPNDAYDTSDSRSSTGRSRITEEVSPGASQSSPSDYVLAIREAGKSKRTVPEPDNFAVKKKKEEDDLLSHAVIDQTRQLCTITAKLHESINPNSILNAISVDKVILQSVPVEKHLECIMELLAIITGKYIKSQQE